jgi:dolichyl-phosphate-mannose-protein mannosyltransferase
MAAKLSITLLLLALFAVAVAPAASAYFTADDFVLLRFSTPGSFADAARFFVTDWGGQRGHGGYYRPVINLLLWIDHTIYGGSPAGYRLTNILAHLAATFVLFRIVRDCLGQAQAPAAIAAALFLLHPLHDQAVLWVAGRTDVICGLFYSLAFYFAVSSRRRSRLAALACFVVALLSKEMAITLPALVLVHRSLFPEGPRPAREALRHALPFVAVAVVYLLWRGALVGGLGGDPTFLEVGPQSFKTAAKLLQWVFLPWDLRVLKPFLRPYPSLLYGLALLALSALALGLLLLRRSRAGLFAAVWTVVTLLPVCTRPHAWYLYIPSFGATALVAIGLVRACGDRTRIALAAGLLPVGAFALTLRANAQQLAAAASLARAAVLDLGRCPAPCYVLNAPIALAGRFPILTASGQYAAALEWAGASARPVPLNYVYVEDAGVVPSASATPDAIHVAVSADANTFFTLDGIGVSTPPELAVGLVLQGTLAAYRLDGVSPQGKIDRLTILPGDPIRPPALVAYRGGRFQPLDAGEGPTSLPQSPRSR